MIHNQTHVFNLREFFDWLVQYIADIPMAQLVIVFTAFGITVGHFMQGSFEIIVMISQWLCWLFVFGLGGLSLVLSIKERRTYKLLLVLSTLMMFMISVSLMSNHEPKMLLFIIHVMLIFGTVVVFLLTARNHKSIF